MDLKRLCCDLLLNPKHTKWIGPLLILGEALLCALIIWKIPCELREIMHIANDLKLTICFCYML